MGGRRADLWPPYGGVETDLQLLRDPHDEKSVVATLFKPFFFLDSPLSAVGDTLFLPRWAICKAIFKHEPIPPWREAQLARQTTQDEHAFDKEDVEVDEQNKLLMPCCVGDLKF